MLIKKHYKTNVLFSTQSTKIMISIAERLQKNSFFVTFIHFFIQNTDGVE